MMGHLLDLGLRDYKEVWDMQRRLTEMRARGEVPDLLILVEHPHVFTVGKRIMEPVINSIQGIPVFKVERGGLWTYHGPGQLVGYPILSLEERGRDIHRYLREIERAIIMAVRDFGIAGERHEGHTGVWVGPKKLASIGVAVRNWVTFHGFALNVNTDLSYFDRIDPCGLPSSAMTSMCEVLGRTVEMASVKERLVLHFSKVFEMRLEPTASVEAGAAASSL